MRFILCILLLSACTTVPAIENPQPVLMPIPAQCDPPMIAEPVWNMPRIASTAPPDVKLSAILADLELSKAYIEELKAELEACS